MHRSERSHRYWWLKRFIDNDTRYEQFLCPPPRPGTLIEEYRDTCPHS